MNLVELGVIFKIAIRESTLISNVPCEFSDMNMSVKSQEWRQILFVFTLLAFLFF